VSRLLAGATAAPLEAGASPRGMSGLAGPSSVFSAQSGDEGILEPQDKVR